MRRPVAAGILTALLIAAVRLPAVAAGVPYQQRWRVQSEVGGDIGGRSQVTVTESTVAMKSADGQYDGTVSYGDRLILQDPQGGVMVQVSRIGLDLTGAPAAGGRGVGGLFEGTARLDDYLGLTWKQATSGDLPDKPTRSAVYAVAGRWAAFLAGADASGQLRFDSASLESRTGDVDIRDASWFNRLGGNSAQTFRVAVQGPVAPGGVGTGAGPVAGAGGGGTGRTSASRATPFAYMRAGLIADAGAGVPAAVPLASSLSVRALRDAKPKGAVALPANSIAIDLDISGLALDAKNRATGQQADSEAGVQAGAVWRAARRTSSGASMESTTTRLTRLLKEDAGTVGAKPLLDQVSTLAKDPGLVTSDVAGMLSEWLVTVRATGGIRTSVLASTAKAADGVGSAPVPPSGPAPEGLLADADSPAASVDYLEVARFERRPDADVEFVRDGKRVIGGTRLLNEALADARLKSGAPVVEYVSARGSDEVAPAAWLAYRRGDEVDFWLAGESGPVAARDGALTGWAFTSRGARVVSSVRCGQTLAFLEAGAPHASLGK